MHGVTVFGHGARDGGARGGGTVDVVGYLLVESARSWLVASGSGVDMWTQTMAGDMFCDRPVYFGEWHHQHVRDWMVFQEDSGVG